MYQAGNAIYDNFDKVLVLAEGRVIFYGPRSMARAYFEELGFVCPKGANVADFLTSVTVATERAFRPGMEEKAPRTAEEFENALKGSTMYQRMIDSATDPNTLTNETDELKESVQKEQQGSGVYTANLMTQIQNCIIR
ncbi:hypothetical protein IMZ48_29245 [Candidatus Bathyarchaeota archaeon]|nr:hypothetical protein [Candidatus Bathyarchaeota archaeon]